MKPIKKEIPFQNKKEKEEEILVLLIDIVLPVVASGVTIPPNKSTRQRWFCKKEGGRGHRQFLIVFPFVDFVGNN